MQITNGDLALALSLINTVIGVFGAWILFRRNANTRELRMIELKHNIERDQTFCQVELSKIRDAQEKLIAELPDYVPDDFRRRVDAMRETLLRYEQNVEESGRTIAALNLKQLSYSHDQHVWLESIALKATAAKDTMTDRTPRLLEELEAMRSEFKRTD